VFLCLRLSDHTPGFTNLVDITIGMILPGTVMQKALAKGDTQSQIVADLIDICEVLPNKATELYESYSVVPAEENGFDLENIRQQIIEE
jgi:hypothetical protein